MARKWEFDGIVKSVDANSLHTSDVPVALTEPTVDLDIAGMGWIDNLCLTDSVDEARDMLGKRVRVTIEVL